MPNGATLRSSWKYSWLTWHRDQLWFPLAFLALFIVILLILPHPGVRFSIARAYLGFIVPLIGGIPLHGDPQGAGRPAPARPARRRGPGDGRPPGFRASQDQGLLRRHEAPPCRDIAVLARGQVLFRGSPAELTNAAGGHVWTVMTDRLVEPEPGMTIVSMLHLTDGIQYRIVGPPADGHPTAEPARPSLEDGYVWLMKGGCGGRHG